MELQSALQLFERAEANLVRAETIWDRLRAAIPEGIQFIGNTDQGRAYRRDVEAYSALIAALPRIDGWRPEAIPLDVDEIAQARFDAHEVGELECFVSTEDAVYAPGGELDRYRNQLERHRVRTVRARLEELVATVDGWLAALTAMGFAADSSEPREDPHWPQLSQAVSEIERLLGASPRAGRWRELHRHLAFGMGIDLSDIAEHDWPSVRADIQNALYSDEEPLPMADVDLAAVSAVATSGSVAVELAWSQLDDASFERLIFGLLSSSAGYENARWLLKTRAADRGRDLSVERVFIDSLAGVRRERWIVQCKHWLAKSVGLPELGSVRAQMKLHEPPAIDFVVVVTSGRFTADAVAWVEKSNHDGERPRIDLWPESHLEVLLARRPDLIATFGLR